MPGHKDGQLLKSLNICSPNVKFLELSIFNLEVPNFKLLDFDYIWLYKSLKRVIKDYSKNKNSGKKSLFGWRKLWNQKQKDYLYYPFILQAKFKD